MATAYRTSLEQTYAPSVSQPLVNVPPDAAPRLLAGAFAGFVATLPMTAAMRFLYNRLPYWQRYPLPPRRIIANLAGKLRARRAEREHHHALAHVAHYSYGAAGGALYALVSPKLPFLPLLNGVIFGLAVWTASYFGILPAIGALPPATRQPRPRNMLMLAAHFVWGMALAMIYGLIGRRDLAE
jgi:uncharacterized membrane protein YagU involved in acid resistance